MALMVWRIQTNAIPTRRKSNPQLKATVAGAVRKAVEGWDAKLSIGREADELDSLMLEDTAVEASAGLVTGDHAETSREWLNCLSSAVLGPI